MRQILHLRLVMALMAFAFNFSSASAQNDKEVLDVVEQMPEYVGGISALMRYLSEHVVYPSEAQAHGIQGRVICTFVINADGSVSDAKVAKSVDPLLDNEAIRVISTMPKWNPGKHHGKPVRVRYTIPITFRIPVSGPAEVGTVPSVGEQEGTKVKPVASDSVAVKGVVEQMPEFAACTYEITRWITKNTNKGPKRVAVKEIYNNPGGAVGLRTFLNQHVKYPAIAEENGVQGRVVCSFVVEKDGSITNVEVVKPVDPSLNKEALRVVSMMPKWKPGMQDGKPVRVKYTVPVSFFLQ